MTEPRRLWLVRHGETEGQSSIRYHGSNDVPLSDHGRAQIRALAPWLAGVDFAHVVHSPLSRATESAAILVAACGLPQHLLRVDERLREFSFGLCEGLTIEEIEAAFPDWWRANQAGLTEGYPGGERRVDFAQRVGAAARELAAEAWRGDVLVVVHRGTVRQALRALLGFPPGSKDPFAVELGSLTVLRERVGGGGAWELELVGALPE